MSDSLETWNKYWWLRLLLLLNIYCIHMVNQPLLHILYPGIPAGFQSHIVCMIVSKQRGLKHLPTLCQGLQYAITHTTQSLLSTDCHSKKEERGRDANGEGEGY